MNKKRENTPKYDFKFIQLLESFINIRLNTSARSQQNPLSHFLEKLKEEASTSQQEDQQEQSGVSCRAARSFC